MTGRRDRDAIHTSPSPFPPRPLDRHRDPWREVQEHADHDLAERTAQAIYHEGN